MATLGDLKTRIRLESGKDDIASGGESETALTTAIEEAIEFYQHLSFYFHRTSATADTVASTETVAIPAAIRVVEQVSYNGELLLKFPLDTIDATTDTGTSPTHWAEDGSNIRVYPIPDAAYTLNFFGIASTAAPTSDSDTGIWVNEAKHLIAARAKYTLYRDLWTDTERMTLAAQAEAEALSNIRNETRKRRVTPLRSTGDEPWSGRGGFNINRGE